MRDEWISHSVRAEQRLCVLALLAVGTALAWWGWGKWVDVVIDFGRELYIPWQLTEGKTLYADLAYFNGPLSPYLNALWFKLFGVSLRTLVFCNLAIIVVVTALLAQILTAISDRLSATVACAAFLAIFAFAHFGWCGNLNFVCPYSHEMTHGITLALVAVASLRWYHRTRRLRALMGAGFAVGLAFLTKAEIFLAAGTATAVGVGLTIWDERPTHGRLIAMLGAFIGSAIVPGLIALSLLSWRMPLPQALRGTLGTWPWVFERDVSSLRYVRVWGGFSDPAGSLKKIVTWTAGYLAIFAPVASIALLFHRGGKSAARISTALALWTSLWLCVAWARPTWWDSAPSFPNVLLPTTWEAGRPLPLVMLILGAACAASLVKRRGQAQRCPRDILQLTMIVLAFLLLGKIIFFGRVFHYGFALAMPATLLSIVTLMGWIPSWLTRHGGTGRIFRAAGLAAVVVAIAVSLAHFSYWYGGKTHLIGSGPDAFLADQRGPIVHDALRRIAAQLGPNETVMTFPNAMMLNYLARRTNGTSFTNLNPLEFYLYGEDRVLAALQDHPPDYIVLVHYSTASEGARFFGRDYAQKTFAWIRGHYHEQGIIGARPFQKETRYGILLLQRVDASGVPR